jgi:hypothetical protein
MTGLGEAADAVVLGASVAHLLVSDSTVVGGQGDYDTTPPWSFVPDGGSAIVAPDTVVTVVDSHVEGGAGRDTVFTPFQGCPSECSDVSSGTGGDAVEAVAVYHAGAQLVGGRGALIGCSPGTAFVCLRPSGLALRDVSSAEALPGTLFGSGPMPAGSYWTVTWETTSPGVFLLLSPFPAPPVEVPGEGLLHMPDWSALPVFLSGDDGAEALWIPDDASLHGTPLVMQLWDPVDGLGRPVVSSIVPR